MQPMPSILESFIRGAATGGMFDTADNVSAAGYATIPLDSGASTAPTWLARYMANIQAQQQRDALARAQHGTAWQMGDFTGNMLNPIFRFIPARWTQFGGK